MTLEVLRSHGVIMCFRYFGDKKFEPNERVTITQTENVHKLTITECTPADAGMIIVKAINEVGQMSGNARLKVKGERIQGQTTVAPLE